MKKKANTKNYNLLSDEDFNNLSKYADLFEELVKNNRLRSRSRQMSKEVAYIVDNHNIRNYSWSCGTCMYNLYKRAADLYYDNLKYRNAQNEPESESDEQPTTES